ncbi:MAG: glycosyl transferase [Cryobacterium sp.]|jgi:ADP-heptose:LPS heptosyltransferase|nr:glycosyl transferase [Cryobacterium sp.]
MTRRVLVARLDSIGDVLLAGPAIRAVAGGGTDAQESAEVWMLCGPQGTAAAHLLPSVHRVLTWDCPWITDPSPQASVAGVAELVRLVAECAPDAAVILTSFHQSPLPLALLLRLAGVKHITGASVDFAGSLLDVRLRPGEDFPEDQPETHRALAIAAAAGFRLPSGDDGRLAVLPPPQTTALTGPAPYLVVHPGSLAPSRTWPPGHFREAVQLLGTRGYRIVVTGSESERQLTAAVAGTDGADLGGRLSLRELSAVLAGAGVVITGNTGPAHLAAAVGTPVVSLFSPVVPAVRWAPYGVAREILGDQEAACRDTRARVCPVPEHPCLAGVTPAAAVTAALALLARTSIARTRIEGVA